MRKGVRKMERKYVSSTNLKSVGYDEIHQTLEIEFVSGGIYQYYQVPLNVYIGLMNAASHGSYFDLHVKKAGYPCRKVG